MHDQVAWAVIATGVVVFVLLLSFRAPYGRHARGARFGPEMPTRWAWVVMEAPAVLLFAAVYLTSDKPWTLVPLCLFALWQLHYVDRTFLYPWRIRAEGKRTPLVIALLGFAYQTVNAWLNASHIGAGYDIAWLYDPRFVLGVALFFVGRAINRRADRMLVALRDASPGYSIPRGWLYRYVSCPNYFGEIIEWTGWAVATWSWAGASFAVFTAANLVPRALAHHRWYRSKFDDYPTERRAVIPFVL